MQLHSRTPPSSLSLLAAAGIGIAVASVEDSLAAISVSNIQDVRGNLHLPSNADSYSISWRSSDSDVISTNGLVTRPSEDSEVTLIASVEDGGETHEREFNASVRQAVQLDPFEAYAFSYFTGSTLEGESIFFAASNGNDALDWQELNNGEPVLRSEHGTGGLRDPFIIRSPEGDTFYMIATDLSIGGGTPWDEAVRQGSHYLEVWESHDLVEWSEQRHVRVAPSNAGNTWAPEAFWDAESGSYAVFWASSIYDEDEDPDHEGDSYHRMFYALTRDFVTFGEPQVWQDAGDSRIDTTVLEDAGVLYRFTKDEGAVTGCTDIIQESGDTLLAPLDDWTIQASCIGADAGADAVEGPTAFKANPDDVHGGDKYYLFVDEYGGRGYIPLETEDIANPEWQLSAEYNLPSSPRHGTVIPVTAAEHQALVEALGSASRSRAARSTKTTRASSADVIADVTLSDPDLLKHEPVVNDTLQTVVFPVQPGTDLTTLSPVFSQSSDVTSDPESGETVDLSAEVTYTFTDAASGDVVAEYVFVAEQVNSPVLPGLWADPNIEVVNDTYYIYATTDGFEGWGGKDFYWWKSADLATWTRGEEPFLTLDGENGNVPWATGNAWAPGFASRDGKYYFYFSGENLAVEQGHKSLGVAVADHPEGPFVAEPEPMIVGVDEEVVSTQSIDAAAFRDPQSGDWYLYWGSGEPAVVARLADDMVSLVPGSFREVEGLADFREALFVNYREGTYHMTYSIDDTRSEDYRVGYATADDPLGPWTYRGVILEKDPARGIYGTGHNSVVNVPETDDWFIVYHRFAIPDGGGFERETAIDRIEIDPETGLFLPVTPTLGGVGAQPIREQ